MNIKQLEAQEKKQLKELIATRRTISQLKNAKTLPLLKKKYEGKYFKYRNSYGSDEEWWLYTYCIEVLANSSFKVISFQKTSLGKIEIEEKEGSDYLFAHEITMVEFKQAWANITRNVNSMNRKLNLLNS